MDDSYLIKKIKQTNNGKTLYIDLYVYLEDNME